MDDKIFLPEQFKNDDFRFCLVEKGTKKGYETHNKKFYKYDDPHFLECLKLGDNYGIFGYNLVIVDCDTKEKQEEIEKLGFPETYEQETGIKKLKHKFYITPEQKRSRNFNGFDIRGGTQEKGYTYVVGTNSILTKDKKGNKLPKPVKYKAINNLPIARITNEQYNELIKLGEKDKIKREGREIEQKARIQHNVKPQFTRKKISKEDSLYIYKEPYLNKPIDIKIKDILPENTRFTYPILIESLDDKINNHSFDFNKRTQLNFLKEILKGIEVTIWSENAGYLNKKTNKPALEWKYKIKKKNDN